MPAAVLCWNGDAGPPRLVEPPPDSIECRADGSRVLDERRPQPAARLFQAGQGDEEIHLRFRHTQRGRLVRGEEPATLVDKRKWN